MSEITMIKSSSSKKHEKEKKKKSKKEKKDKEKKRSSSSTFKQNEESKKAPKRLKTEESQIEVPPSSSTSTSKKTSKNIMKIEQSLQKKSSNGGAIGIKQLTPHNDTTTKLQIQVSPYSQSSDPVVISFPAGLPSSLTTKTAKTARAASARSVRFEDEETDTNSSSKLPAFTWTAVKSARGRLIHGNDDTCTYISSNGGRGHDGRNTKLYVGVYHKPTASLKLIPSAEKGTVFAMNQSVTSYHDSKSLDFRNMSLAERRRMVFESFGSQKKKKVLRSQQANVVEMRSVVGAGEGMMKAIGKQMESNMMSESNLKVMQELKNNKGDGAKKMVSAVDKAYAEARRLFLPPFDESASKPYRVYDSQEVAGEDAWGQISRTVDACLHKGDEWKEGLQSKSKWAKSTSTLLASIFNPTIKKGAKYQIKTIVLVNHLIKFHNKASKKFLGGSEEELAKYLDLPRDVANRFLALFCVPTHDRGRAGFAISKQLKDRRVIYTLVMYLLAHGKEMKVGSIEALCKDMELETKDAMNLYREAGCKCAKNKAGMVSVSLSVPLAFPPPKRGKK
mmetsp:Transcript_4860/g.5390  ORF Transcript_4860/g.5390 Transcript_4860/m.5390 type:complete len:562 (-) Transcript_4860:47-1732(-)